MGNIEDEIANYIEELSAERRTGDRQRQANILHTLATIYSTDTKVIDFPKALNYYDQALHIYQDLKDWLGFYKGYRSVGVIYVQIFHDSKRAMEVYEFAIANGGQVLPGSTEEGFRNFIVDQIARTNRDKCGKCGKSFADDGWYTTYEFMCPNCHKNYCYTCSDGFKKCNDCKRQYCPSCAPTKLKHCGSNFCNDYYCEACLQTYSKSPFNTCAGCGTTYCANCDMQSFNQCEECLDRYCHICSSTGIFTRCPKCRCLFCKNHPKSDSQCPRCDYIFIKTKSA